jgi:hypothetical protein
MGIVIILTNYLLWHYSKAIVSLFGLYRNFVLFIYHLFSLPILFRTWISPWRRLNEGYPKSLVDFSAILETLLINTLMRLVGFVMRTIVIFCGLFLIAVLSILFPVFLIIWIMMPFLVVFLFLLGVGLLFK